MQTEYDNETIQKIKSIFPETEYMIVIENLIIKISKKESKSECISFIIEDTYIHIYYLYRCDDIRGPQLLTNIFNLAQELTNIKYIQLNDVSQISIYTNDISLSIIKILTTGHSWYNNIGYKSTDYENEKKKNKIIIETQYNDFIGIVFELLITKYLQEIDKNMKIKKNLDRDILENPENHFKKKLIKTIETKIIELTENKDKYILQKKEEIEQLEYNRKLLFPDVYVDSTVQLYFNNILSKISKDIESKGLNDPELIKQCKWLSNFINMIEMSGILTYNIYLKKYVKLESTTDSTAIKNKYIKYKNKYLNLKNQLG
jgi:hypothetical protein